MSRVYKSNEQVRDAVLDAARRGIDTIPAIHIHVAKAIELLPAQEHLMVPAYANRTASAMASTRKAIYELIDAGELRSQLGKVALA